jgi:integrase
MKGHIRQRSSGHWAIILDIPDPQTGKRRRKWHAFSGTKRGAQSECARLITEMKSGEYIEASKLTVGQWCEQWINAGAPGRRKKKVGQRTLERYDQLLRTHVKPKLGARLLQKLQATEIDQLYIDLEALVDEDGDRKIAPMTLHHVHTVFNSCLSTAERKGLLKANPMSRVEQVPSGSEGDHGLALDEADLATLVAGFKASPIMYAPVAVDAATGVRRNELLAFRWIDFAPENKTLKVERALEVTKKFGVRFKAPKTWRGRRTIALDDGTVAGLLKERERHLRLCAGVPDGAEADLSLIRLPDDALIFPAMAGRGKDFSLSTPRDVRNFTKAFTKQAKLLGFDGFKFHHLRGTHATLLLDRGVPAHTVAERLGDDPAVLLRNYAKRKRQRGDKPTADAKVTAAIDALAVGFLGPAETHSVAKW